MGYVVLPPCEATACLALGEARWTAMTAATPSMAPAVALQRALLAAVLRQRGALDDTPSRRLSLPGGYLAAKLASGTPALAHEPVPAPVAALRQTAVTLCEAVAAAGGGDGATAILSAMQEDRLDMGAALTLALHREQSALRTMASQLSLSHDLLWLIVDLAVSPFAAQLRLRLLDGEVAPRLALALSHWTRGYCPLCGSWPALAELVNGQQVHRCALCAAAWTRPDGACSYCETPLPVPTADPALPIREARTCEHCHGYLKRITTAACLPFPLVAIADLDTMDLDLDAMQRRYTRPAPRAFPRKGSR